ncbi:DEAD/DEAH box helicase family protein [Acidobacteriota bacterium]
MTFIDDRLLSSGPWQALERVTARLMVHGRFKDVRLIGRTGDGGADILASKSGKRYLVQVKFRSSGSIGNDIVDEVLEAARRYRASIPVLATNRFFGEKVYRRQSDLHGAGVPIQLWDGLKLKRDWTLLPEEASCLRSPRKYQEKPIENTVNWFLSGEFMSGLIIMATGLGKTFVAASSIRQLLSNFKEKLGKVLVLAHTNELVYQLEKAFWPFLNKRNQTAVWNGYERGDLISSKVTFACIDSVSREIERTGGIPVHYDLVVIDEAHHAGSPTYRKLIAELKAGERTGSHLLGMTATPWRSDEQDIEQIFKEKLCSIDIIKGLANGYLANVDYRMHLDNIKWSELKRIKKVTPRSLNRTLFIQEWNDSVIDVLQKTWSQVQAPKAIVFCSTIEHAFIMREKINARGFSRAELIFSGTFNGKKMSIIDRSRTLCDFSDGIIGIMCAVDIFNEGIDVPDVNILVFQRVTHSRRIFVQQLGRGLRISEGKEKVIVLDFVSDIRRIAAGLQMKEKLSKSKNYLKLGSPVKFFNKTGEDPKAENFFKEWLEDVAAIQEAGEDDSVLKYPPDFDDYNDLRS